MLDQPHARFPHELPWELPRPALHAALTAPGTPPFAALVAPAGYGKTTLLAQLTRPQGRVLWWTLTPDDADPAVLAARVARALAALEPGHTPHLRRWWDLEAPERPPAADLARVVSGLTQPVVLVFDGLEWLGPSAGRWLGGVLEALDPGVRVFLAGRDASALPLAALVAAGRATLLTTDELAFTEEEVEAYLQRRGAHLPGAQLAHLRGWPAGVALGASGATAHLGPLDLVLEVLGQLPDEVRRALPEAAVFPVWEEHEVRASGAGVPPGWLGEVRRAGVLLSPLGGGRFRPHALLLGTLERELRADAVRHRTLHTRAGELAEARGDALAALAHYHAARQHGHALRLAGRVTARYLQQSEYALLRQVLRAFDEAQLPPELLVRLGVAHGYTGEAAVGEALLRRVHDDPAQGWRALPHLSNVVGRRGDFGGALRLAEEGLAHPLLQGVDDQVQLRGVRCQACRLLGRFDEALGEAGQMVSLAEEHARPFSLGRALSNQGQLLRSLGRHEAAEAAFRRSRRVFEELGLGTRGLEPTFNLITLYVGRGRVQEADGLLGPALALSAGTHPALHAQLLVQRATVERYRGRPAAAARTLETALDLSERCGEKTAVLPIQMELADVARQAGNFALSRAAFQAVSEAEHQFGERYGTVLRAELALRRAIDVFRDGHLEEAGARLAAFEPADLSGPNDGARLLAFRAETARRLGRLTREDVAALVAHLELAGSDAVLGMYREELAELFAACVVRGWWPERFTPWVSAAAGSPRSPQAGTVTLNLTTLGPFAADLGGHPLTIPLSKSRELLVYLALHGPATGEHLIDALFDGSREERHRQYFRRALRVLREALRGEALTQPLPREGDRYRLHERLLVRVDVADVLEAADPSLFASWPGPGDDLTFLPGVRGEWAEELRARVLDRAAQGVWAAGRQVEAASPGEALAHYRRALRLDPLFEEAHQAIIALYRKLDNGPGAHAALRDYRQAFGSPAARPAPGPTDGP